MTMPLRCRCGAVRGEMDTTRAFIRVTCYCKDCRAYGRFLATPGVLDDAGGTDVVASAPAAVRFTHGIEHVACASLSATGLLRWYAACCRTPLGNTLRDKQPPFVGLMTACIDATAQKLQETFGPRQGVVLNASSATAPVRSTPRALLAGSLRVVMGIVRAHLRAERASPFFNANGRPLREAEVIDPARRAELER